VTLYVARRGWHTDIGIAAADVEPPVAALLADFPGARYLMFGFGDRRYLLHRQHGGAELLSALWPGPGLLLVTGLSQTPAMAFGKDSVLALELDRQQLQGVEAFVAQSLSTRARSAQFEAQVEAEGPYSGSLYYGATPRYSAVHTCNTWVAEAIHAGGLPVRPSGVVFARQLWVQVLALARAQRRSDALPGSNAQ